MLKIKAALWHLMISIAVFSVLLGILIIYWYPSPYFYASGGFDGLKIAASVDLVLGPLLTAIVFNTNKSSKELITDLSIIVVLQISALLWGIATIYQQRPVANVFWGGHFLAVTAADLNRQNYDLAKLSEFGDANPVLIYLKDPEGKHKYYADENSSGSKVAISPYYRTDLYQSFSEHFSDIEKYQIDMSYWISTNSEVKSKLMTILEKNNRKIEDYQYYKIYSNYRSVILIFNTKGVVIDTIIAPLNFAG